MTCICTSISCQLSSQYLPKNAKKCQNAILTLVEDWNGWKWLVSVHLLKRPPHESCTSCLVNRCQGIPETQFGRHLVLRSSINDVKNVKVCSFDSFLSNFDLDVVFWREKSWVFARRKLICARTGSWLTSLIFLVKSHWSQFWILSNPLRHTFCNLN